MNYNVRIDDNFLKAEHVDGEVLQHTDLNELESVVKTAINANYEDIQKLQLGEETAGSAAGLEANEGIAILSQYQEEALQASDSKVPSSLQVKSYVDNLFNTVNVGLIYFWDGTDGQESADVFNAVCRKYDNGEKFVFFGRCIMDTGYYDDNNEWVSRSSNVIMPIMVSKRPQPYPDTNPNQDWFSFATPPYFFGDGYTISGISLTGTWGNFTNVMSTAWSQDMAPVSKQEVEEIAGSPLNEVFIANVDFVIPADSVETFHINPTDARRFFTDMFGVSVGRVLTLKISINSTIVNFIGELIRCEFTGNDNEDFYATAEFVALGASNYKAKVEVHFEETDPTTSTWTYVNNENILTIYKNN